MHFSSLKRNILSLPSFVIQNVSRDREIKGFVDAQTTNLCLLSETCSISMMEKCRKLECQVNVTVSGYIFRPFEVKVNFLGDYYSFSKLFLQFQHSFYRLLCPFVNMRVCESIVLLALAMNGIVSLIVVCATNKATFIMLAC